MNRRRQIHQWLATCALSGVLGISACGGAPANGPGEAMGETSAALTTAKPIAHGVVHDGAGAGIAHARVDVRAAGSHRIVACATTASDGTFALDVRAGTYDLMVTPRTGFAPQIFPGQVIAKGTELELIIARAPRTVNLTGHVTDQNGQPLSVSVCAADCVDTGDSGAFAISARTDRQLEITGGGFQGRLAIDPAQSTPLDIVIPIFNLTGTVLDPTGAPMANVSVTAPTCSNITSGELVGISCVDGTQTDSNGHFHFTSLPGDLVLHVSGDASGNIFGDLGMDVTESVTGDADLTIQVPPLQSLSGRITDRDGNGLPGHRLCLMHSGCASRLCSQDCVSSDGGGSYTINLSPGTYDAELFSPLVPTSPLGFYVFTSTITLSQSTELDFTFPNRVVTGTVLNVDGTPAANVAVSDNGHDANVSGFVGRVSATTQTSDANGRFQMVMAAPGDVVLTARGATTTSVPFTVIGDTDVVVQLQATQPATGQVLAADGSPVAGVIVCYDPPIFTSGDRCSTTDAGGQYQLSLTPGTYAVSVSGSETGIGFFTLDLSATVPSAPAIIRLAATRSTPVRIVNTDGSPLAGVSVSAVCFSAPAAGTTEDLCGQGLVSDAAGAATVVSGVGVPMAMQINAAPGFESPSILIDEITVGDNTELTIAIQSSPSP